MNVFYIRSILDRKYQRVDFSPEEEMKMSDNEYFTHAFDFSFENRLVNLGRKNFEFLFINNPALSYDLLTHLQPFDLAHLKMFVTPEFKVPSPGIVNLHKYKGYFRRLRAAGEWSLFDTECLNFGIFVDANDTQLEDCRDVINSVNKDLRNSNRMLAEMNTCLKNCFMDMGEPEDANMDIEQVSKIIPSRKRPLATNQMLSERNTEMTKQLAKRVKMTLDVIQDRDYEDDCKLGLDLKSEAEYWKGKAKMLEMEMREMQRRNQLVKRFQEGIFAKFSSLTESEEKRKLQHFQQERINGIKETLKRHMWKLQEEMINEFTGEKEEQAFFTYLTKEDQQTGAQVNIGGNGRYNAISGMYGVDQGIQAMTVNTGKENTVKLVPASKEEVESLIPQSMMYQVRERAMYSQEMPRSICRMRLFDAIDAFFKEEGWDN